MYLNAEEQDRKVVEVVARIAENHGVPRAHVALAWLLAKPAVTAPIIGATKLAHLATAIDALAFSLSDEEIAALEAPYVPHPVDGVVPPLSDEPLTLTPPRN
jgi:aryl-alcohol dehydrogenase-like predicted oxidoreductase